MREQFDTSVIGLEGACAEGLVYSLTNADARYNSFLFHNHVPCFPLPMDFLSVSFLTLPFCAHTLIGF